MRARRFSFMRISFYDGHMSNPMNTVYHYLESLYPILRESPEQRLAVVKDALRTLGDPQDSIPAIHIAGTSGKGSTAYYAAAMLQDAGYSVGLAVSPHVNTVRERSQVNGALLPENQYYHYFQTFVEIIQAHHISLSYIEFLTVFTYWLFRELQLDYIVIETGLGGRLAPTNSISRQPNVRAITDIGLDHTEVLGTTLGEIAAEKAGIIHRGDMVVLHAQGPNVMGSINRCVAEQHATLEVIHENMQHHGSSLPSFQRRNWTLAAAATTARLTSDGQAIPSGTLLNKSLAITIPGRFEQLSYRDTTILLDAAHNTQKITALVQGVKEIYKSSSPYVIVALGANKASQSKEILGALTANCSGLLATTFTSSFRESVDPLQIVAITNEVYPHLSAVAEKDPYSALERGVALARQNGEIVIVTGSFYLIDGIRRHILTSTGTLREHVKRIK